MHKENYFGSEKKRYETSGINTELDVTCRFIIWSLIDTLKEQIEIDYLQVFEFVTESETTGINHKNYKLKLIHSQEEPYYKKEYVLPVKSVINGKIFVIDDGDHVTMMWADEY